MLLKKRWESLLEGLALQGRGGRVEKAECGRHVFEKLEGMDGKRITGRANTHLVI